jgi:hypothetical protein
MKRHRRLPCITYRAEQRLHNVGEVARDGEHTVAVRVDRAHVGSETDQQLHIRHGAVQTSPMQRRCL